MDDASGAGVVGRPADERKHYAGVWRVADRRWSERCTPLREYLREEARVWEDMVLWAKTQGITQAWLRNMLAWMEVHGWIYCAYVDQKWQWRARNTHG